MDDLIEALQIFRKYGNPDYPTHCEHDEMWVDIDNEDVSDADIEKLDNLGFFINESEGGFTSFKFGSC